MLCPKCGAQLKENSGFCDSCGSKTDKKNTPHETKIGKKKKSRGENPAPSQDSPKSGAPGKSGFSVKGYFKNLWDGFKNLIKNPKRLIISVLPAAIISVFWIVLSILEGFGKKNWFVRILSTITYAQGGMFGGFFGTVGGIIGKAMFAYVLCAVVTAIVNKRKIGLKGLFKGFSVTGLDAAGILLAGAGTAALLYLVFNITSSSQNIMVAVSGIGLMALTSSGGGLLMQAVCGIAGLLSGGKTPSAINVSRFFSGMTAGFALVIPLSFFRSAIIIPIVCAVLLAIGIILCLIGMKIKKAGAAVLLALLLLPSFLISPAISHAAPKEGDWITVEQFYDLYDLRKSYEYTIKGSQINRNMRNSDCGLVPTELKVTLYKIQNGIAIQGARICGFEFPAEDPNAYIYEHADVPCIDSMLGKAFTLNSSPQEIRLSDSNGDQWVEEGEQTFGGEYRNTGKYTFDYNITLSDIVYTCEPIPERDAIGSPFSLRCTANGTNSTTSEFLTEERISDKYAFEPKKDPEIWEYRTSYEDVHVGESDNYGGSPCFLRKGEMLLVIGICPSSEETVKGDDLVISDNAFRVVFKVEKILLGAADSGVVPPSSGKAGDDNPYNDNWVEIGGVLTAPDETRKGVPLKDYDGDGDIDYLDRRTQNELIHDPDYLTRHGKAGSIIVALLSLLTGLAGGGAATAAGAVSGIAGAAQGAIGAVQGAAGAVQGAVDAVQGISSQAPLSEEDIEYQRQMEDYNRQMATASRYVREDKAGNIVWRDPASGREYTYEKQEDGTYGDGLTADDINQNTLHILRNMDYYDKVNTDYNRQMVEYNVQADKADKAWDSYYDKLAKDDRDAQIARAKELADAEQRRIDLRKRYNLSESASDETLRDVIRMDQEFNKDMRDIYNAEADTLEKAEKYASGISTGADVLMDALETATGPVGKALNAGYKVVKGAAGKGAEAYYAGEDVSTAVLQGGIEGGIDAGVGYVKGPGYKAGATVAGETAKGALDSYIKGEDVLEGTKKGFVKGSVNAAVDFSFDFVGDELKDVGEGIGKCVSEKVGTKAAATVAKTVQRVSGAVDFGGNIADNLAKNYISDKFF